MAGDHSSQQSADRGLWFVLKDGQELGPISTKELAGYLADGLVSGSDLVRRSGQSWMPADKIGQVDRELPSIKDRPSHPADASSTEAARKPPLFPAVLSLFGSAPAQPSDNLGPTPGARARILMSSAKNSVQVAARRVRDYALRHWRGDLSLPVACLVNGVLVAWPLALVAWLGFVSLAQASVVPLGLGYILAVVVPLAILAIWQVGLWRSADKFAAGGGDWRWATLAKAVVVLAIGSWAYDAWTRDWQSPSEAPTSAEAKIEQANFQQAKQAILPAAGRQEAGARVGVQDTGTQATRDHQTRTKELATEKLHEANAATENVDSGPHASGDRPASSALRTHRHQTELELTGVIGQDAATEFKRMLDATPEVKLVRLNSPGGEFSEAKLIGAEIKRRGLTTTVSQTCASACIIIFLSGRERSISHSGKLGFHAPSPAGLGKDQATRLAADEKQALLDTGLPLGFIDRAMATNSTFVPSRDELISAGIITGASEHQLRSPHRFHHVHSAGRRHRWAHRSSGRDD